MSLSLSKNWLRKYHVYFLIIHVWYWLRYIFLNVTALSLVFRYRPKHKQEKDTQKYSKKKRIKEFRKKLESRRQEWEELNQQAATSASAGRSSKKLKRKR